MRFTFGANMTAIIERSYSSLVVGEALVNAINLETSKTRTARGSFWQEGRPV